MCVRSSSPLLVSSVLLLLLSSACSNTKGATAPDSDGTQEVKEATSPAKEKTLIRVAGRDVFDAYIFWLLRDQLADMGVEVEVDVFDGPKGKARVYEDIVEGTGFKTPVRPKPRVPDDTLLNISHNQYIYANTMAELTKGESSWDILVFGSEHMADFGPHLVDMTPEFLKSAGVDFELEGLTKQQRQIYTEWQGVQKSVPLDQDLYNVFYNKVAFEREENKKRFRDKYKAELAPPRTWEEWDRLVEFFDGWAWDGGDKPLQSAAVSLQDVTNFWPWRSRFFSYGGTYFDHDMNPLIDSPAGVRALEEMQKSMPHLPKELFDWDQECKIALMQGEIAMLISWGSTAKMAGDPKLSKVVGKIGYSPMPGFKKGDKLYRAVPATPGRVMAVAKYSKKQELATRVVELMSNPKNSLTIVRDARSLMDPWRPAHFDSPEFRNAFPGAGEFLDAVRESTKDLVPELTIPGGELYRHAAAMQIVRALKGEVTAKEALATAAKEWRELNKSPDFEKRLAAWRAQEKELVAAGFGYDPKRLK